MNKTPLRTDTEDTSTQPSLFETSKRRNPPLQAPHVQPPQAQSPQTQPSQRRPSVQRQESEAAFRASQGQKEDETPPKPKTQAEKDDAFEKFLRKHDDLGF